MDVRQKTIKNEIRDILKSYYFTEWEDDDDCINTLMPKIEALISQNYIPKERVLSRDEIKDISRNYLYTRHTSIEEAEEALELLVNALLKAGSIEKVGVEGEIPISEAKSLATKYGYEQIIILAQKESKDKQNWLEGWRATFNKDKTKCKFLGKVATILAYNFRAFYSNEKLTNEHYKICK